MPRLIRRGSVVGKEQEAESTIVKAEIRGAREIKDGGNHFEYEIATTYGSGNEIVVYRRYRKFDELVKDVEESTDKIKFVEFPRLPAKKLFGRNRKVAEERIPVLQTFLNEIIGSEFQANFYVKTFLQPTVDDGRVFDDEPEAKPPPPTMPPPPKQDDKPKPPPPAVPPPAKSSKTSKSGVTSGLNGIVAELAQKQKDRDVTGMGAKRLCPADFNWDDDGETGNKNGDSSVSRPSGVAVLPPKASSTVSSSSPSAPVTKASVVSKTATSPTGAVLPPRGGAGPGRSQTMGVKGVRTVGRTMSVGDDDNQSPPAGPDGDVFTEMRGKLRSSSGPRPKSLSRSTSVGSASDAAHGFTSIRLRKTAPASSTSSSKSAAESGAKVRSPSEGDAVDRPKSSGIAARGAMFEKSSSSSSSSSGASRKMSAAAAVSPTSSSTSSLASKNQLCRTQSTDVQVGAAGGKPNPIGSKPLISVKKPSLATKPSISSAKPSIGSKASLRKPSMPGALPKPKSGPGDVDGNGVVEGAKKKAPSIIGASVAENTSVKKKTGADDPKGSQEDAKSSTSGDAAATKEEKKTESKTIACNMVNGDVRNFTIPPKYASNLQFDQILPMLSGFLQDFSIVLNYKDEDGDMIAIKDQEDLELYVAEVEGPKLSLFITAEGDFDAYNTRVKM